MICPVVQVLLLVLLLVLLFLPESFGRNTHEYRTKIPTKNTWAFRWSGHFSRARSGQGDPTRPDPKRDSHKPPDPTLDISTHHLTRPDSICEKLTTLLTRALVGFLTRGKHINTMCVCGLTKRLGKAHGRTMITMLRGGCCKHWSDHDLDNAHPPLGTSTSPARRPRPQKRGSPLFLVETVRF